MAQKKRIARRRLCCDHCRKPIEIGQPFYLLEKFDEHGRMRLRYHDDCRSPAFSTRQAARMFGEAA